MKTNLPIRKLPEKPDLDQLRRQAKELLADFLTGEARATAEVNAHYHGAKRDTFALHDAQLVLARAHGFVSWPRLKAFVDGITVRRLADAVRANDTSQVRALLKARPELINMDQSENDERHALHFAVLGRSAEMVRLLMELGANARKGIYPHRPATEPLTMARERGYDDIVSIIEAEEQRRRQSKSETAVTSAQDDLIEAIWDGDDTRAIAMMERDAWLIHGVDRRGIAPLHIAAATLNLRVSEWLLEHGAQVNQPGPDGRTPFDVADGSGWRRADDLEHYAPLASLLRRHGAELTPRSAVAMGDMEWVKERHAAGTLTNPIQGPGGLLSVAVRHDRTEMLRLLLDLGLDPDERTRVDGVEEMVPSWGMPLHHCAGLGKYKMAEMLLEQGADPNGQVYASGSVMYSALAAKDEHMAKLLERYGGFADAATLGHLCMTERAREMLADFDAGRLREGSHNPNGSLAGELLWAGLRGGCPDLVRLVLPRMEWPRDHEEWFGKLWSPLPQGGARSQEEHTRFLECFRLVLERANPNVQSRQSGRTVLHDLATPENQTADRQAVDYATLLLDAGARTDIREDLLQSTPLGWACRWGAAEIVKLLLLRGADPIESEAEPWATPRAWAERSGNKEILELLSRRPN